MKPKEIRFFRKVMKNMLSVALGEVKKAMDMKVPLCIACNCAKKCRARSVNTLPGVKQMSCS